jgi:hypothetical protein
MLTLMLTLTLVDVPSLSAVCVVLAQMLAAPAAWHSQALAVV